jgi:hypothetical protein
MIMYIRFLFIHRHSTARLIYKKGRVKLCERGTMGICWRIAFDILRTSDARMGQEQRLHPEYCSKPQKKEIYSKNAHTHTHLCDANAARERALQTINFSRFFIQMFF